MEQILLLLKYLFLGALQGFTEPIPISSSGHLVLAEHFLGIKPTGMTFELLVNTGSLIAVLLIYRHDIFRIASNTVSYVTTRKPTAKADYMFFIYLLIATIPAGVLGFLFEDTISLYFKGLKVIGVTLLITGAALWLIRNLRGRKNDAGITLKDALIIGLAQAVALIPGISRSGSTIVAAMAMGLKQDTALRFSFMMYIPVSLGGMLLSFSDILQDPYLNTLLVPYLVAFVASTVISYFSLRWFMGIMARGNLKYFAYYCFIVGTLVTLAS